MRLFFTFGSLLVVLAIVAVSVRTQLKASQRVLPAANAASDAPAVPQGSPQQVMSQYQRELDKAMKAGAQHTADQAASAADEAR
jgi:hypothetical protein